MQNSSDPLPELHKLQFAYPTTIAMAAHEVPFPAHMASLVSAYRDLITGIMGVEPSLTETVEAMIFHWQKSAEEAVTLLFYVSTSRQGEFVVGFSKRNTEAQKIVSALKLNDGKLVFDKGQDIEFFVAAFNAMLDSKGIGIKMQDGLMYCWLQSAIFVSYYTAGVKSTRIEISFSSSSPWRNAILSLGSEFGGKIEPQPEDPTRRRSAPRKRGDTDAGS